MAAWDLTRWRSGAALTRQFAILGFIVIGLITVALSMMISHSLRKDLLEREWGITADCIHTGILYHLTPSDLAAPRTRRARMHFETLHQQAVMMPEIVRVKIYDAKMRVVWSDEPRLIGQRVSDNPHLLRALAGRTTVNLETGEAKTETLYERNEFARVVEVRDTGVGIPPEALPKIFEPFHTTKAQGTGLGLAIAKKLTEAQGGTIAVESRPGEGATFRVTFPVHMGA